MAKVDVIMPQMGESIAEGTLTKWLKEVGDEVERDEDLFEISTDKVDADIPAPQSGVLSEKLVDEGETVEVNTVVARIETEAEAADEEEEGAPAEKEPAAEAEEEAAGADVEETEAAAGEGEAEAADEEEEEGAAGEGETAAEEAGGGEAEGAGEEEEPEVMSREERLRKKSTPVVRKIAAEHDVDIEQIEGSGLAGRVTKDDIEAYLAEREEAAEEPEAKPAEREEVAAAAEAPREGFIRQPIHGATLDIRIPEVPVRENDRVEEMSRVRMRTMEHMLMSQQISAHVTSVAEIDFERVVRLRRKFKPKFQEQGVKLTYGPFIMKAVVEALQEYPILNASVKGTQIVYHGDINLGIAVAVNDGKELLVPVLKDADKLSLMGLAEEANDLARRARDRELDFDDIQGGTFTITNVGVFGNLFGTPIINQPQVAILGTGVIEKRPVVVQDETGADTIAIHHMAYFGLSYDHRVVDGAMAAFFLNKVQEVIENFPEEAV